MKKFTYLTPAGDTGTVTALNSAQARDMVAARNGVEERDARLIALTRIAVKTARAATAHVTSKRRG